MKIAIVGNNDGPLRLAKSFDNPSEKIVFVGLQKKVTPALKAQYESLNIPFQDTFKEEKLMGILKEFEFDYLINCFCNFKFTRLLEHYTVLNVHPSPLPVYRGRHPLHWALINGEKNFGISIHKMTPRFDAGVIYWQKKIKIPQYASVQQLREKLMTALEDGFPQFISALEKNSITPQPNLDAKASYIPRRYPEDSALTDWDDAKKIVRKTFALASEDFPAFIQRDDERTEVTAAKILGRGLKHAEISGDFAVVNRTQTDLVIETKQRVIIEFEIKA